MKKPPARPFSRATFRFLAKASRQKNPAWLEKNRDEYETTLLLPLKHLAESLKRELQPIASGYHFPQKGIGRLRRPAHRAKEYGGLYKDWIAYSASRPSGSRFDHNPNLYFMIHPADKDDPILVAGGLYMASSRQTRAIREAIAADATPFDRLFASKEFRARFKGGFSRDYVSSRPPRGFDPAHPRMDLLKLQAFFVWRAYTKKEFASKNFPALVAKDWRQILRLNDLLEKAITGNWAKASSRPAKLGAKKRHLSERLEEIGEIGAPDAPRPQADF